MLINPAGGAPTFFGTNANGRFIGGFADIYLDVTTPGTLSAGDVLLIDDTFLVANHSGKSVPGQSLAEGDLNVLPNILRGADPGGAGKGVG